MLLAVLAYLDNRHVEFFGVRTKIDRSLGVIVMVLTRSR